MSALGAFPGSSPLGAFVESPLGARTRQSQDQTLYLLFEDGSGDCRVVAVDKSGVLWHADYTDTPLYLHAVPDGLVLHRNLTNDRLDLLSTVDGASQATYNSNRAQESSCANVSGELFLLRGLGVSGDKRLNADLTLAHTEASPYTGYNGANTSGFFNASVNTDGRIGIASGNDNNIELLEPDDFQRDGLNTWRFASSGGLSKAAAMIAGPAGLAKVGTTLYRNSTNLLSSRFTIASTGKLDLATTANASSVYFVVSASSTDDDIRRTDLLGVTTWQVSLDTALNIPVGDWFLARLLLASFDPQAIYGCGEYSVGGGSKTGHLVFSLSMVDGSLRWSTDISATVGSTYAMRGGVLHVPGEGRHDPNAWKDLPGASAWT